MAYISVACVIIYVICFAVGLGKYTLRYFDIVIHIIYTFKKLKSVVVYWLIWHSYQRTYAIMNYPLCVVIVVITVCGQSFWSQV